MDPGDLALEPCVYCGEVATTKDHVVPRAFYASVADTLDARNKVLRNVGVTVPACFECNCNLLGDVPVLTVLGRRQVVKRALKRKYRKLLSSPDWTDAEIAQLKDGGILRQSVINAQEKKRIVRRRIEWQG